MSCSKQTNQANNTLTENGGTTPVEKKQYNTSNISNRAEYILQNTNTDVNGDPIFPIESVWAAEYVRQLMDVIPDDEANDYIHKLLTDEEFSFSETKQWLDAMDDKPDLDPQKVHEHIKKILNY